MLLEGTSVTTLVRHKHRRIEVYLICLRSTGKRFFQHALALTCH